MEMVRYCPACGDEFRPEIAVCSDCGGALILQPEGLGAAGVAGSAPSESEPGRGRDGWRTALDALPISTLLPVRTFDALRDLEPAVAAFADLELPSRVLVQNGRYILLVHPETLAEAQIALHALNPDQGDRLDPAFDATAGRYSNCPACSASLPEASGDICPECGLELNSPAGSVTAPEAE
jgi:hypothetical protein